MLEIDVDSTNSHSLLMGMQTLTTLKMVWHFPRKLNILV